MVEHSMSHVVQNCTKYFFFLSCSTSFCRIKITLIYSIFYTFCLNCWLEWKLRDCYLLWKLFFVGVFSFWVKIYWSTNAKIEPNRSKADTRTSQLVFSQGMPRLVAYERCIAYVFCQCIREPTWSWFTHKIQCYPKQQYCHCYRIVWFSVFSFFSSFHAFFWVTFFFTRFSTHSCM